MRDIDWDLFSEITSLDHDVVAILKVHAPYLCADEYLSKLLEAGSQAVRRQDEDTAVALVTQGLAHLVPQEAVAPSGLADSLDDSLAGSTDRELFPLVFFAYVLPNTLELFARLPATDTQIKDTLCDIGRWIAVYRANHGGALGCDRYHWLMHQFCAHLVQLGRLQYQMDRFPFPYTLYRSRTNGAWHCLADAGLNIDSTGHIGLPGTSVGRLWTTIREVQGDRMLAHETDIDRGVVLHEPVSLYIGDLESVIVPGSAVLRLHIPEGGPLDPAAVDASLALAQSFFSQRNIPSSVLVCDSWLLDPALDDFLPTQGNICAFMHRFMKFPVFRPSSQSQIFERVFGSRFTLDQLDTWPCTTRLQISLRDYLRQGGHVYTTGGFLTEWCAGNHHNR